MIGWLIVSFLAGAALTAWMFSQMRDEVNADWQRQCAECAARYVALENKAAADAATHADECHRFRCATDKFIADREAWNRERTMLAELREAQQ